MYQKLLLATDGSPNALRAAEATRELAVLLPNASVTVMHVLALTPELTMDLQEELESQGFTFEDALKEKAHPIFQKTLRVLEQKDIKIDTLLETGHAAERINEAANSGKYDLVIIGNRGLGDWQEILLGSISEKVCHGTRIPVLIIK